MKKVESYLYKTPLKAENIPTHHHREHNVLGTTQASFRAIFKATSNKLGQKRHP